MPKSLLLSVAFAAALCAFSHPAAAHPEPPLNPHAVFRTAVPHLHGVQSHGPNTPGVVTPSSSATFTGTLSYSTVGDTVTPTTTMPEAEEEIAVDPNNAGNLVAAISDFSQRGGYNTTKYAYSTDNGMNWSESFIPRSALGYPVTADGRAWEANSDPVLAWDRSGHVYLVDLYFNASNNANGLYVSVGTGSASGVDLSSPPAAVLTNTNPLTSLFEDKPWIAVDNSSAGTAGNVYVSWTHFAGYNDAIYFSRSTNYGRGWSRPIAINLRSQNGAVQGSQVAVGPNGAVYVAYEVFYAGGECRHFLAKSTNGGRSFSTPVAITRYFYDLGFAANYRTNSFAALAVSPTNGNVYVVYADQSMDYNNYVGAEIEFIASTDGGATFTLPVALNDHLINGQNTTLDGHQFMPAVAVDGVGSINVSWFDTRNSYDLVNGTAYPDPLNPEYYDIYATRSTDNGQTFGLNTRATSNSANPTFAAIDSGTSSNGFIGDYAGIAAAGGSVHPVWTNGGFNLGQLQTAALQ